MTHVNAEEVRLVVATIAQTAIENEHRYGELDAVVGDGDFGYSLARGFESVLEALDEIDDESIGALLKRVGMLITMKIGGTSGPLWGTAFLRAASVCQDDASLSRQRVVEMLRAGIEGIQQRGHAELGDKTLLDALVPAVDELERAFDEGADAQTALGRASEVARTSAETTREMVARRGRAAYAGERSVGPIDAGAAAVAEMFVEVDRAWRAREVTPQER